MVRTSLMADNFNKISVYLSRKAGQKIFFQFYSKEFLKVLQVLVDLGMVSSFSEEEEGLTVIPSSQMSRIKYLGKVNVKHKQIIGLEKKYLLDPYNGNLILTTPQGIMSSKEAFDRRLGGFLIAYVY